MNKEYVNYKYPSALNDSDFDAIFDELGGASKFLKEFGYRQYGHAVQKKFFEVTQTAANKAAEEGRLPALPDEHYEVFGEWRYDAEHMQAYARAAITADRASRQVAKKAEVDLTTLDRWEPGDGGMFRNNISGEYVEYREVKALVNAALDCIGKVDGRATPPATTGSSTAREAWEYNFTHSSAIGHVNSDIGPCLTYDKAQAFGVGCFGQKRVWVSVGASTVLTDERIWKIWQDDSCPGGTVKEMAISHARAVLREVAAQAGQVAVPKPIAWLSTDLDGRGDVAFTKEEAERRAGYGCNEFFPLFDAAPSPAKESK